MSELHATTLEYMIFSRGGKSFVFVSRDFHSTVWNGIDWTLVKHLMLFENEYILPQELQCPEDFEKVNHQNVFHYLNSSLIFLQLQ